jgi:hypothetical protein
MKRCPAGETTRRGIHEATLQYWQPQQAPMLIGHLIQEALTVSRLPERRQAFARRNESQETEGGIRRTRALHFKSVIFLLSVNVGVVMR